MKELANDTRDIARELARKYSTMTHDELDVLESILVPMKFSKGEMNSQTKERFVEISIIQKKDSFVKFYFKNGKQITEHLGEDHSIMMCIESLFREEPTKLQVEALEPTLAFAIPKQKLEQVALHNVNIQILYRKILEESLIISQVHADLVRFETAQARYKRMCKLYPQVILRAPLVYIASYLQMTPETLSRVRSSTLLDD